MDLRVEPITGKNKKQIKKIYLSSFLKEDRMPFGLMRIMAKMNNTDFVSFYDNDILCGFAYMAIVENLVFVMFFAVDENLRSKGYGSRILEKIQSLYPDNKIIVSIERCDEAAEDIEERIRRKNFYLKNEYIETGYLIELSKKKQEILIKNGIFDEDEFTLFFKKYSNGSMKPKIFKEI